jgi:hypothetical protein
LEGRVVFGFSKRRKGRWQYFVNTADERRKAWQQMKREMDEYFDQRVYPAGERSVYDFMIELKDRRGDWIEAYTDEVVHIEMEALRSKLDDFASEFRAEIQWVFEDFGKLANELGASDIFDRYIDYRLKKTNERLYSVAVDEVARILRDSDTWRGHGESEIE